MRQLPKLRTVEKYKPLYPLNKFPKNFALNLGKEIVYLLSTRASPRLEGTDWEEIFARIINAKWKPSNVGLDDIVFEQTAWGAKTVKNAKPSKVSKIRLISGRNSPIYSFGDKEITNAEPNNLGEKILSIYNERVTAIRKLYKHLRTIVLIKSDDLLETSVFEFETITYQPQEYRWKWNENNNLVGYNKSELHAFTWQPHGSQFTIIENVPKDRLSIRIKEPPILKMDDVFKTIKFDESWIEIL
ncbi:MAG: hypothetical protein LBO62_01965 [Endomicrobium sp.]|jgi:hypothetical protein|nr:hypothetical protein [Endomicrobium sp.]